MVMKDRTDRLSYLGKGWRKILLTRVDSLSNIGKGETKKLVFTEGNLNGQRYINEVSYAACAAISVTDASRRPYMYVPG